VSDVVLGEAELNRLFPYHLILDDRMRIVGAGHVLRRLLPDVAGMPLLSEVFTIERPLGITNFDSLRGARDSAFLLVARSRKDVRLKGEVQLLPGGHRAVLFTVLWLADPTALDRLDVTLGDFALSDPGPDLIFLIETQSALLRDAGMLSERLRSARDEAISASRMKSEFLANMSHELRTPLNAIIGFSEYLLAMGGESLPTKYSEYVGDIRSSGLFLLDIINDLLDLSRIEAGKLVIEPESVELGAVVRDTLSAMREKISEKALFVSLSGFDDPVWVHADLRLMRQIFLNLVSNAVKFNRDHGVLRISAGRSSGDALSFAVTDSGIGVDPAIIPELFEPFRQANSSVARRYGGTGLGLVIVRQLMQLHGGEVTMTSRPGVGTTVAFTLPDQVGTGIRAAS
jgi:signal transduction histidine kinase